MPGRIVGLMSSGLSARGETDLVISCDSRRPFFCGVEDLLRERGADFPPVLRGLVRIRPPPPRRAFGGLGVSDTGGDVCPSCWLFRTGDEFWCCWLLLSCSNGWPLVGMLMWRGRGWSIRCCCCCCCWRIFIKEDGVTGSIYGDPAGDMGAAFTGLDTPLVLLGIAIA